MDKYAVAEIEDNYIVSMLLSPTCSCDAAVRGSA